MRVTVAEHQGRYRVWLDGEDISADCFAADDVEGWADCYVRGEEGSFVVDGVGDGIRLRTERREGRVELRPTEQQERAV